MSGVESTDHPGQLYFTKSGSVYRMDSLFTEPSALIIDVATGRGDRGGIGCLNFQSYTKIEDANTKEHIAMIESLASDVRYLRDDCISKQEKNADLKLEIADLKMEISKLKRGA